MPAPEAIQQLVETFSNHLEHYKSAGYNETEVRREFLDPFWKALGWDIDNTQGYADAYKDVIHEDAIKIGGWTKAPDYCFRIGGTRKFFLEAKKPSVAIKSDEKPAYQLRRYGWSAKLPLSILSDFEEFAVYDTRIRPNQNDKSSTGRTLFYTYDQYTEKWDEIAAIFSREAVLKGSFDKYADTSKKKRGTAEVDDAFLEEIERWRDTLARNFALRNPELTVRNLNYAVQKTIDRIIFLRICEDRGTEDYGRLNILQNGSNVWLRLNDDFRRADDRYNSGLFHFKQEKGRQDAPDRLTPELKLDDKVLKDIIKHLYYPDSPYEFSVLPSDILGQVYEQFLGKTIRLTENHQAKIEEKPEVRKAGGVYYTPSYIVDYIVENTLGRLLNGKDKDNPKPIPVSQAAKLKICDPACGSGSFLIVAYQYLLDWHRDQYTLNPISSELDQGKITYHSGGKNPKLYQAKSGHWKLTTPERKRILLNNIYGVDIDSQAVEVTKLSLLLKVLEGETQQQLQRDFISERQRILPDLGNNIQCGNSLIGSDFYKNEQMLLLDDETKYRINVFDWETAFPEVFQQGGFDCVVGNPPYIRIQSMREYAPIEAEFYSNNFESAAEGNFDIYVCFLERALRIINPKASFGYILPHKFFTATYGRSIRRILSRGSNIRLIVSFGADQVFKGATTYTCLFFGSSASDISIKFDRAYNLEDWRTDDNRIINEIPSNVFDENSWHLLSEDERCLLRRIKSQGTPLNKNVISISQGLKTGADPVYVLDVVEDSGDVFVCESKALEKKVVLEKLITLPLSKGGDFKRFQIPNPKRIVVFPYDKNGKIIAVDSMKNNYPNAWAYLLECRPKLDLREKGRFRGQHFYQFSRGQCIKQSNYPKVLTPDLAPHPNFTIDSEKITAYLGGASGGYGIVTDDKISAVFLLGLLNSSLLNKFIALTSSVFRGGWFSYEKRFIEGFPIRPINFDNPSEVAQHNKMVSLVERMLDLHKTKTSETNPNTLKQIEMQIAATDRQIDRLVYELYELTDEEIALIEQSV